MEFPARLKPEMFFRRPPPADITLRVPSNARDIPSALKMLEAHREYGLSRTAEILLEAGYQNPTGVKLRGGSWGGIKITSEDPVVPRTANFVGVSNFDEGLGGSELGMSLNNLFVFYDCDAPTIACLFDMDSPRGVGRLGNGISATNATVRVAEGGGVINAGIRGIVTRGCRILALESIWDGAGSEAIRLQQASHGTFQSFSVDGACADPSGDIPSAVFVSRTSTFHGTLGTITGTLNGCAGLEAHRSPYVSFTEGEISGNTGYGVQVMLDSEVNLQQTEITGNLLGGIRMRQGGDKVDVTACTITGNGDHDIIMDEGTGWLAGGRGFTTTNSPSALVPNIDDISGPSNFNLQTSFGIVTTSAVEGPLNRMARFSDVGARNGARFAPAAVLEISRDGTLNAQVFGGYNPNGLVGGISIAGMGMSFNTTSDETRKTFTGAYSYEDAVAIIRSDPVRRFTWNEDGTPGIGWGAQTSYGVSHELASPGGWFDRETGEASTEGAPGAFYQTWGVDQGRRTPYLWAALSGLIDIVEALQAEVDDLRAQVEGP